MTQLQNTLELPKDKLVVVSGQSGVGKSKINERLPDNFVQPKSWVDITRREPRGEQGAEVRINSNLPYSNENVDWSKVTQAEKDLYNFLDPEEFEELMKSDDLLTVAEVQGCFRVYRKSDVRQAAKEGKVAFIEAAPNALDGMINGHPDYPEFCLKKTPNLDFLVCQIKDDAELSHLGLSYRSSESQKAVFERMATAEMILLAKKMHGLVTRLEKSDQEKNRYIQSMTTELLNGNTQTILDLLLKEKTLIDVIATPERSFSNLEHFENRLWSYVNHPTDSAKSLENPEEAIKKMMATLPEVLTRYIQHEKMNAELKKSGQMVTVDFNQRAWSGKAGDVNNGRRSFVTSNPKAKSNSPRFKVKVLEPNPHIDPVGQIIKIMENFAAGKETTQEQIDKERGLDRQRGLIDCFLQNVEAKHALSAFDRSQNILNLGYENNGKMAWLETLANDEVLAEIYKSSVIARLIGWERKGGFYQDRIEFIRSLKDRTLKSILEDPTIDIGLKLQLGEATKHTFLQLKEKFYNREEKVLTKFPELQKVQHSELRRAF